MLSIHNVYTGKQTTIVIPVNLSAQGGNMIQNVVVFFSATLKITMLTHIEQF